MGWRNISLSYVDSIEAAVKELRVAAGDRWPRPLPSEVLAAAREVKRLADLLVEQLEAECA